MPSNKNYSTNPYLDDEGNPKDQDRSKVHTVRATGAVYLYGPELDIVDTPEFQRLAGIKQLGTSYFVFRGAVHTRFEHSLGTLQQAQNIIDAVRKEPFEGRDIDPRGQRLARLGALLHDLPHVPFGHTLEDEFGLLCRHDENQPRLDVLLRKSRIGEILRGALGTEEYDMLLHVLDAVPLGKDPPADKDERIVQRLGEYAYVTDIVANTVCADVLDYIVRDNSACGMPVSLGSRFLDFFAVTPNDAPVKRNQSRMALRLDKRGMPRPDVESEVIKLLTYRYELAERVFFHHAKNAASVMIGRAVERLGLDEDDANFHYLSDDLLLTVLANPKVGDALKLKLTKDAARRKAAETIGKLVNQRKLYKLAYLGVADDDRNLHAMSIHAKYGSPAERQTLEDDLAAQAGLQPGDVLIHLPDPKMMTKLAKVRVLLEDGRSPLSKIGTRSTSGACRHSTLHTRGSGGWGCTCIPIRPTRNSRRTSSAWSPRLRVMCSACRHATSSTRSRIPISRRSLTCMSKTRNGPPASERASCGWPPRPRRSQRRSG
jgi:HD superfamily phosphohydrolase